MRSPAAVLALTFASMLLLGCGEEGESRSENKHVSAFRAASGFTFQECGVIHTDCLEYDCGAECPDQRETTWSCIDAAFETCRPAHFQERVRYATTSWSTDDVFLVPQQDGSCKVVRIQVARASEVGCNHVARWDCSQLHYGKMDQYGQDWCALWIDGCGEPANLEGEVGDCWL